MNATIEKIVNMLFNELEETEETRALREETLTNCQERYEDMLARGLGEDEAIHAVMESLSGMEEMLAAYPRKADCRQSADFGDPEAEPVSAQCYDPATQPIHEIVLQTGCADVNIEQSNDGLVHVTTDEGELNVSLKDGVLRIESAAKGPKVNVDVNLDAQQADDRWRLDGQSRGFDLSSLMGKLKNWANSLPTRFGYGDIEVQLPADLCPALRVSTTNGDLTVYDLTFRSVSIATTSGDIDINEVRANGAIKLSSTSGDVSGEIDCETAEANTISGDIELDGSFAQGAFKAVSGDVTLEPDGLKLRRLAVKTTSGDIHADLDGIDAADVRCHTLSGDVRLRLASDPSSGVKAELSSVSGDITVQ